jgi:hypothetical protein
MRKYHYSLIQSWIKHNLTKNHLNNGAISLRYSWMDESRFTKHESKERVWVLIITLRDATPITLPCKVLGKYITAKDNKT